MSGSLSRTPPSVYQRCFDGGKFTMPRARYPPSSSLRSSRTGRNASAFAAEASATSVGDARGGSTSSRTGCPDVNVNVAQSSEVVARTCWRSESLGTRYSRPRSDANAITMRIGTRLAGAGAVSRSPVVVTGIEQIDGRPTQRFERQRLVGSVGAHHQQRVTLHPRLADHVDGIDALEEASGRQHPGDRPRRRAADGVDRTADRRPRTALGSRRATPPARRPRTPRVRPRPRS